MITDYQHQLPHTPVIGTLTHRAAALQTLTLMENMRTFHTCSCLHRCMMVIMFMLMVMVSAGQRRMIVW